MLLLDNKRANDVTCTWKVCSETNFELPSIADHRWDQNTHICWIKEPFPKGIEKILISYESKENEVNNGEGESDNEGDTF